MKKLVKLALLSALFLLPGLLATAQADIRYCCTPQQVQACVSQGGTTSCRTNVCQCLF